MSRETERLDEKWLEESRELTKQRDSFVRYFNKHKKCSCTEEDCKHLYSALRKVLGDRLFAHFKARIDIGFRSYYDLLEENRRL